MVLLYANPNEVRYVTRGDRYCIGYRAESLNIYRTLIQHHDRVILFGSCGSLMPMRNLIDLKSLWIPERWFYKGNSIKCYTGRGYGITSDISIKCKKQRELYGITYDIVDMESYHVGKLCEELGVPFLSVRYIIDGCDRKILPTGLNWAIRRYQHKRMQRKFNEFLEGL
jgi:hypothetical protein